MYVSVLKHTIGLMGTLAGTTIRSYQSREVIRNSERNYSKTNS